MGAKEVVFSSPPRRAGTTPNTQPPKRATWDARTALGFRESQGLRLWLVFATLLGLVANVVILIGCVSSTTIPLYLYRVDPESLASAIDDLTDTSASDLNDSGLPDYWYWGMSGICAVWSSDSSSTICERSFPPIFSVPDAVELSISGSDSLVEEWEEGYADLDDELDGGDRGIHATFMKAGGALAIISLICGVGLFSISLASLVEKWIRKPKLWLLYLISVFDSAMLLGSGILVILGMNRGPREALIASNMDKSESPRDFLGPGMYVIFAGSLIKFAAVAFVVVGMLLAGFIGKLGGKGLCGLSFRKDKGHADVEAQKKARSSEEDKTRNASGYGDS